MWGESITENEIASIWGKKIKQQKIGIIAQRPN